MTDLSEELNKPTINKFERKKIIVNHINEIHSPDLVRHDSIFQNEQRIINTFLLILTYLVQNSKCLSN